MVLDANVTDLRAYIKEHLHWGLENLAKKNVRVNCRQGSTHLLCVYRYSSTSSVTSGD